MTPILERVDHIHVFVADREVSEQWYASVMGFKRVPELVFWSPNGGPLTIGNQSETIHLALFERPREKCRSTIALTASAAEFLAWRTHLKSVLGQPVEVVDHGVSWSLYFSGPDTNPFEITSYEHAVLSSQLRKTDG